MSIIEDAVFSSTSRSGQGIFKFNQISYENKMELKDISKRQRKNFKEEKLIPNQVLKVFFNMGFLPEKESPKQEMRINDLINYLKNGKYQDSKNRDKGTLLRDRIEEEEFPESEFGDEKFVKSGGKLIPVSYLRTIPGTIFR